MKYNSADFLLTAQQQECGQHIGKAAHCSLDMTA